ncbi:Solute-binding protein [Paraburkholderia gardini]|nr:Solute-binding protein [Paraburkholderia gardini]
MRRFTRMISGTGMALLLVASVAPSVFAANNADTWNITTSYPPDTVSGHGIATFASELARATNGNLVAQTHFGTPLPSDVLDALKDGRFDVASVFASSLIPVDSVFALSTLPFEISSIDEARQLACMAREQYEKSLGAAGLHLLFVTPWPPTGIWSKQALETLDDFEGLRLRAYDKASAGVFTMLGAKAVASSASEMQSRVESGQLDAVLSSGDGEVGRAFAPHLPNFTAVSYAYPLSFVVVSRSRFNALSPEIRAAVQKAATETERLEWKALPERVKANYAAMVRAGIDVHESVGAALRLAMHAAGAARTTSWLEQAPSDARALLVRSSREDAEDSCGTSIAR